MKFNEFINYYYCVEVLGLERGKTGASCEKTY